MKILKVGIAGYGVVGKRRKECIDRHPSAEVVEINRFSGNDGWASKDASSESARWFARH